MTLHCKIVLFSFAFSHTWQEKNRTRDFRALEEKLRRNYGIGWKKFASKDRVCFFWEKAQFFFRTRLLEKNIIKKGNKKNFNFWQSIRIAAETILRGVKIFRRQTMWHLKRASLFHYQISSLQRNDFQLSCTLINSVCRHDFLFDLLSPLQV